MDFEFSLNQLELRDKVKCFVNDFCIPEAARIDKEHFFPVETWKRMAEIGLLKVNHREKYGGAGTDPIKEMIVIEELSKASLTHGASYALLAHGFPTFIEEYGTEQQKKKYILPVLEGQKIGAFCLTEAGAGSDARGIQTRSQKSGTENYVLKGRKQFVTAGSIADYLLIVARADEKSGESGYTGFIVSTDAPGVVIERVEEKMGIRGLPTAEISLKNVVVEKSDIVGGENGVGKMLSYAQEMLDVARIGTGAQALGVAEAAYECALRYAQEREQFGQLISANQGIRWYLSEMAVKIELARLAVYYAASKCSGGSKVTFESAAAKLSATTYAREVVNLALQIHGGYGYMTDFPLERMYRDVKVTEIYEGTSEVMKTLIANQILSKQRKLERKRDCTIIEPSGEKLRSLYRHLKGIGYKAAGRPEDLNAEVVIGLGNGIRNNPKEGLRLADELAKLFGGCLGATRPVVDSGWLERERQIGQSGICITPKLYIALGISGAPTHMAGIKDTEYIVAFNQDADAEIFNYADYMVCGDIFQTVPAFIKVMKEEG